MSTSQRRLSCAKCDILQPENGKILGCFHIICPGCATDSLDPQSNCIKCSYCGDVTEPLVNGIPLVEQLPSCEPSLYNSADTTAQLIAAATGGGQERRLCDLCDEGSEGEATHSCERCNGTFLCANHAENHSRRRLFTGHVVELLSGGQRRGKVSTLGAESARCFFHKNSDVVTFCTMCSHAVCAECLSSSGHDSHAMLSLLSVVQKERSSVKIMAESMSESTDATPTSPLKAISSLIEAASQEMEEMREEAKIASTVVTDTFDHIESVLQKKRQELLQKIDETHWQQLEVSESRQQRLYRLEETHTTLVQLTESLTRGEMRETEVFRSAGMLKKGLGKMKSDLLTAQAPQSRTRITAMPSTANIRQIEEEIISMMQVTEASIFDVTKSVVTIPDDIYACEEFSALVTLPIHTDTPTPVVTATCIAPSAKRSDVGITWTSATPRTETAFSAQIKSMEEGVYTLEIRDSADRVKSMKFTSAQSRAVALDPRKCSHQVTVSNNNMAATHTGGWEEGWGGVAAVHGYTTGKHSWNVRVCKGRVRRRGLAIGVTVLPATGDYNGSGRFFDTDHHYYWYTNGHSRARPSGQINHCQKMENGDTVTLTLDCDNATLELHHHRTNMRHTVTEVDCSQPLYPGFCMCEPNHQVELY